MKAILSLLLLFSFNSLFATPIAGDCTTPTNVILNSQTQVDQFVFTYLRDCNTADILGDLTIKNTSNVDRIDDLTGLNKVVSVGGNLTIQDNTNLITLDGLQNITTINGALTIHNNNFQNLTDLEGIVQIGRIAISNNSSLSNLNGLQNLTAIGTTNTSPSIYIDDNPNLSDISALAGLNSTLVQLSIQNNNSLVNLTGLEQISSVGSLSISDNDLLQNLTGLSGLTTITGSCFIGPNIALQNLNGLNNLESVGSNLTITGHPLLTDLSALSNVHTIGGLSISDNDMLTTLDDFSSLTTLDIGNNYANISIINNEKLASIAGLDNLSGAINGTLGIGGNPLLTAIDGLNNITGARDGISIFNNASLLSISGFTGLNSGGFTNSPDDIIIFNNAVLESINGFTQVVAIGNRMSISDNPALTSISGFTSVTIIGSDIFALHERLTISNNDALVSISGFPNLTTCKELIISDNEVYNSTSGFSGITNLERLIISDNPALTSLPTLNNNQEEIDIVEIDNNDQLVNLNGFSNVLFIENFKIRNNDNLTSLSGLGITVAKTLEIESNANLTSLAGLDNLSQLLVGGDLRLIDNPQLTDISALTDLNFQNNTDLEITGNLLLSDCSITSICNFITGNGNRTISNNKPNSKCETEADVEIHCLCPFPVVAVTVIDDCNNSEFSLSVNLSDLPNGMTLNITNNGGAADINNVGAGTYVVGPFTAASYVTLNVIDANDSDCLRVVPDLTGCVLEGGDQCSSALTLALGAENVCNPIYATNLGKTDSGHPIDGTCDFYAGGDTWFVLNIPGTEPVDLTIEVGVPNGSIFENGEMAVYTGNDCNNLSFLICDGGDSGTGFMPLLTLEDQAPGLLFIRVWEADNNQIGPFSICAYEIPAAPEPPENDECLDATTLTLDGPDDCTPITSTNVNATASSINNPGCASYQGGDVWFEVTVPPGDIIDFAIETSLVGGSSFTDGGMAIYTGNDCGQLVILKCDDDDGPGTMSRIELFNQSPGTKIYVRVWEYGNNSFGEFGICAYQMPEAPEPPDNDECSSPTILTLGGPNDCTPITGTNLNATASPHTNPGCANYQGGGVWFEVTVPPGDIIDLAIETSQIEGSDFLDGGMAVYTSNDDCSELDLLDCNNYDSSGNLSKIELFNQSPGTKIYVRVWDNGNNDFGDFGICAYQIPVDLCPDLELFSLRITEVTAETASLEWITGGSCSVGAEYWIIPFDSNNGPSAELIPGTGTPINCSDLYQVDLVDLDHGTIYDVFAMEYCANGAQSEVIYLGGFSTPPINDNVCDAIDLTTIIGNGPQSSIMFNGTNYPFTNFEAGAEIGEPTPAGGACDGQNSWCATQLAGSVWFSFTAPASGNIDIAVTGTFDNDLKIALWEENICENNGINPNATMVAANDNYVSGEVDPRINNGQCLIPGRTYYVQVGAVEFFFLGTFDITLSDPGIKCPVAPMGLNCNTTGMAISTGMGEWIHLYENGQVVASVNDLGNDLGNINFEVNTTNTTRTFPNGLPYLNRNWKITVVNNLPALVRFYFTPAELAALGITGNDLQQIQELNLTRVPGGECEDYQSGGEVVPNINYQLIFDGTNHMIQYAINGFSSFYLHAGLGALPVELTDFTATAEQKQVRLNWQTVSETDNEGFFISRSKDGRQWDNLGFVNGKGESTTQQSYQFMDAQPNVGLNYYRLIQQDFDGQQSFSNIEVVTFSQKSEPGFQLFPNPNRGTFFLSSNQMNQGSPLTISIFNPLGKLVLQKQVTLNSSPYELNLPATLENGVYFLNVKQDHQPNFEIRLVVLRN